MKKRQYLPIFIVIIIIASGGGLNELAQLSMYPLYKFLAADLSVSALSFQHIIGIFFIAAFFGSLSVAVFIKFGSLAHKLLVGLFICFCGALLSVFAGSEAFFAAGRFLLGFGSGIIYVVCTAGVMEFFSDKTQVKLFGLMTIVFDTTLVLSIATVVFFSSGILTTTASAIIAKHVDWRSMFVVLLVIYGIYFLLTVAVKKAMQKKNNAVSSVSLDKSLRTILANKHLCIYILAIGCYMLGNIVFMVSSPILFIDRFHLSTIFFSSIFVITIFMSIAGAVTITFIKKPKNPCRFCTIALIIIILNVLVLFVLSWMHLDSWVLLLISYSITNYFFSLILPLITQLMLSSGGRVFGMTASINQSFTYLVCWVGAVIAAMVPEETLIPASSIIFLSYVLGFVLFVFAFRKSMEGLRTKS